MDQQTSKHENVAIILLFIFAIITLVAALYSTGNVSVSFLIGLIPGPNHLIIILIWIAYILSVIFGLIYAIVYRKFIFEPIYTTTGITFFIVSVLLSIAALISKRHFKQSVTILILCTVILFLAIFIIVILSERKPKHEYGLTLLNYPTAFQNIYIKDISQAPSTPIPKI